MVISNVTGKQAGEYAAIDAGIDAFIDDGIDADINAGKSAGKVVAEGISFLTFPSKSRALIICILIKCTRSHEATALLSLCYPLARHAMDHPR